MFVCGVDCCHYFFLNNINTKASVGEPNPHTHRGRLRIRRSRCGEEKQEALCSRGMTTFYEVQTCNISWKANKNGTESYRESMQDS